MTDSPKEWWTKVDAKDEKLDGNDYDAGYHDGIKEGITRGVNMMVDKCKPVMRALWLARAERAYIKASKLRYMWHVLVHVKYSKDKEFMKKLLVDYEIWCWVGRKCRQYADKFKEDK